jgi:hypothetical protein
MRVAMRAAKRMPKVVKVWAALAENPDSARTLLASEKVAPYVVAAKAALDAAGCGGNEGHALHAVQPWRAWRKGKQYAWDERKDGLLLAYSVAHGLGDWGDLAKLPAWTEGAVPAEGASAVKGMQQQGLRARMSELQQSLRPVCDALNSLRMVGGWKELERARAGTGAAAAGALFAFAAPKVAKRSVKASTSKPAKVAKAAKPASSAAPKGVALGKRKQIPARDGEDAAAAAPATKKVKMASPKSVSAPMRDTEFKWPGDAKKAIKKYAGGAAVPILKKLSKLRAWGAKEGKSSADLQQRADEYGERLCPLMQGICTAAEASGLLYDQVGCTTSMKWPGTMRHATSACAASVVMHGWREMAS